MVPFKFEKCVLYVKVAKNVFNFLWYFRSQGLAHPAIEDVYDDPALHEIGESIEELDFEPVEPSPSVKSLKIKKS